MHRVVLNKSETGDQIWVYSSLSFVSGQRLTLMRIFFFTHSHLWYSLTHSHTCFTWNSRDYWNHSVYCTIYCRLKLLNNSACTHRQTHAQPWAPVCGLSGAADGWLIDWGGPLMISVANDLLNNSLGLCWRADGRPNTYMDMLAGTLVHTHAFICTLICIYSNIYTHSFFMHTEGICHPVSLPCCSHLGCFTSALPSFPDTTLQSCTIKTKVSRHLYLKSSRLSIPVSLCSITTSVFMHHSGPSQRVFVF